MINVSDSKLKQSTPNLVIDGIKFSKKHAVNASRVSNARKITERTIKLCELIHGLVTDQCFADKDDLVRIIHRDQLQDRVRAVVVEGYWEGPTFASARIRGSLSCMRPAVSMRTTSKPFSFPRRNEMQGK